MIGGGSSGFTAFTSEMLHKRLHTCMYRNNNNNNSVAEWTIINIIILRNGFLKFILGTGHYILLILLRTLWDIFAATARFKAAGARKAGN